MALNTHLVFNDHLKEECQLHANYVFFHALMPAFCLSVLGYSTYSFSPLMFWQCCNINTLCLWVLIWWDPILYCILYYHNIAVLSNPCKSFEFLTRIHNFLNWTYQCKERLLLLSEISGQCKTPQGGKHTLMPS